MEPPAPPTGTARASALVVVDEELRPSGGLQSKYAIERLIGRGGMGVVYAARHRELGLPVAIKVLTPRLLADKRAVARFLREARLTAAIASDHVVRVLDFGAPADESPYLVMERLEGETLAERLDRGPIGVVEVVSIIVEACHGIGRAHATGIVHRDLKPSNLFLTRSADRGLRCTKVLDFGIARCSEPGLHQELTLTDAERLLGSPRYMSPEQVRWAREVDSRTDVWALGVVLYEALTGHAPFFGATVGDTLVKIASEQPTPIRALRVDVPPALAEIVARCLEKSPDQRLGSVVELARELSPFLDPEAVRASIPAAESIPFEPTMSDPPQAEFPRPGRARVRRPMAGVALVAVGALAAFGVTYVGRIRGDVGTRPNGPGVVPSELHGLAVAPLVPARLEPPVETASRGGEAKQPASVIPEQSSEGRGRRRVVPDKAKGGPGAALREGTATSPAPSPESTAVVGTDNGGRVSPGGVVPDVPF